MTDQCLHDAMAALVKEVVTMYDEGKIDLTATRRLCSSIVNVADTYVEDADKVFSLLPDRCTVCFQKVREEELVDWLAVPPETPLTAEQELAQENSLGDVMVGVKVCRSCLRTNTSLTRQANSRIHISQPTSPLYISYAVFC